MGRGKKLLRQKYTCLTCGDGVCGDDYHTVTKYIAPEIAVGDRMKVILLQIFDMVEYDNLQIHEIRALLIATLNEHVIE